MKFLAILLSSVPIATTAFAGPHAFARPSSTALFAKADASSAIEAALAASKEFGATSPEAALAWEAVEDLAVASTDSDASYGSLDTECVLEEGDIPSACEEYERKKEELASIIAESAAQLPKLKSLAEEMKVIKMNVSKSVPAANSPALVAALKEAQAASKKFGADSPEARVAWTEMEEIASSGLQNAMGKSLDEECLVETAMDACMAMDELKQALAARAD